MTALIIVLSCFSASLAVVVYWRLLTQTAPDDTDQQVEDQIADGDRIALSVLNSLHSTGLAQEAQRDHG